MSVKIHKNGIQ